MNHAFGNAINPQGTHTSHAAAAATHPRPQWGDIAQQLRLGIVEGLKPAFAQANAGVEDTNKDAGRKYDSQQVYMLRGFSHAFHVTELQPIWAFFQSTKNNEAQRLEITATMEDWALEHRVDIVRDLTISDKTLTAIVKMQFNPAGCGGAAFYSSLDRGLTILACRPFEGEEER